MAIDSLSGIIPTVKASLGLEDLVQVLLQELRMQNPMKPVENKELVSQIAQFSSLEMTQQLNDNVLQLLSLQAFNQSVSLMNKSVTVATENGTFRGRVTAVTLQDGAPRLTVQADNNGPVLTGITLSQLQILQ
jgi:flagellar basal-body rod modification protein FlgD